jgi:23S rRNA pseudouridine1911/1915/1917 synthase
LSPAAREAAVRQFEIVHDDADIVVVDKAPGVLTVPTARRERNTLVQLVSNALRREVHVVHRLDRDTSGLLVFGKSERAARALMERWREDHERIYAAIVHGFVKRDEGVIESRLTTSRNLDRRSARAHEQGEDARTKYRVVRRVKDATLVDVELDTGRRNQIRVHMAELGHPILGDDRYARGVRPHPEWREPRLALHARLLVLVQPRTRERIRLESPLPEAFTRFLARAR